VFVEVVDFCTAKAESLISPYGVARTAYSACVPFCLFVVGKNGCWKKWKMEKIRTQAKL